jgi:hypothetical protein
MLKCRIVADANANTAPVVSGAPEARHALFYVGARLSLSGVQHSKRLVRVSLIANTGRTTSYKALQNSKIMIK